MKRLALALLLAAPAAHAIEVRHGMTWRHVNVEPSQLRHVDAARAAGIPNDAAQRLADRILRRDADGIVYMTRHGIHADDGAVYAPRFDMASGRHMALDATVGFEPWRTVIADRYTDGPYTLVVPRDCGNTARLWPAGWPGRAVPPAIPAPGPSALLPPGGWWPGAPIPPVLHGGPGGVYPGGIPADGWPLLPPGGVPVGFVPPPDAAPGAPGPAIPGIPVPIPATALLVLIGVALIARSRT